MYGYVFHFEDIPNVAHGNFSCHVSALKGAPWKEKEVCVSQGPFRSIPY